MKKVLIYSILGVGLMSLVGCNNQELKDKDLSNVKVLISQ